MGLIITTGLINNTLSNFPNKQTTEHNNNTLSEQKNIISENESFNTSVLNSQQYVLMTSTQITLNNSLKETLKYLNSHKKQTRKEPRLGDLWRILNVDNNETEKNPYNSEIIEIQIDENAKNIFAA